VEGRCREEKWWKEAGRRKEERKEKEGEGRRRKEKEGSKTEEVGEYGC
jgi:hypothetical protein